MKHMPPGMAAVFTMNIFMGPEGGSIVIKFVSLDVANLTISRM